MTRAQQQKVIDKYIVELKDQQAKWDQQIAHLEVEVKRLEESVQRIKEL